MVHRFLGLSAVNTVHSIAVSLGGLIAVSLGGLGLLLFDDVAAAQPVYGNSPCGAQTITAIATGFFIWDVYVVVTRVRDPARMDPELVAHGILCLVVFIFGQYPFLPWMAGLVLFFESSTPFLNAFRTLYDLGMHETHAWLYNRCKQTFACFFFFSRVLIGVPASLIWWRDMLPLLNDGATADGRPVHSASVLYFFFVANAALNALNLLWAKTILVNMLAPKGKEPTRR